jgi:uncharacterized glyoxalase superfamily protein PhnB
MSGPFIDVIPLLACANIEREHDFLVRVLGFASVGLERQSDGTVVHGEVRIGEHRVWLHRLDVSSDLLPPTRRGPTGGIVVQVPDVDDHYRKATLAGAGILYEPRDQDYGQREYGVRDPEGHLWWIGTPYEEPGAR